MYEELKALAGAAPPLGSSLAPFVRALGDGKAGTSTKGGKGASGSKGGAAQQAQRRELSAAEITACGALSKLAASVATYPSQVLRSRLQQRMDCGRTLRYTGLADALSKTLQVRRGRAGDGCEGWVSS